MDSILRTLHKLLSARAFLRSALTSLVMAKAYMDDPQLSETFHIAKELLEELLEKIESRIGSTVYGSTPTDLSEARRIVEEVVFG